MDQKDESYLSAAIDVTSKWMSLWPLRNILSPVFSSDTWNEARTVT